MVYSRLTIGSSLHVSTPVITTDSGIGGGGIAPSTSTCDDPLPRLSGEKARQVAPESADSPGFPCCLAGGRHLTDGDPVPGIATAAVRGESCAFTSGLCSAYMERMI
jgi:hypothetical protein